jgi:peptidoglycan/LPS O-acetylase OafA/YrhL
MGETMTELTVGAARPAKASSSMQPAIAAVPAVRATTGVLSALANLRAVMVLIVIAHHVATAYAGIPKMTGFPGPSGIWGAFPVVSVQHSPLFLVFLGINDAFFMSLLFLISGVFAAGSLERRGGIGFGAGRIVRLGIPWLIAAVLIAPLAYFPAYMQITGQADVGDFVQRWIGYAQRSVGPAWFIGLLLVFDLIAAALASFAPRWPAAIGRMLPDASKRPALLFLVLFILSALVYTPMASRFGSSTWTSAWPFLVQTSRVIHYALYFVVGLGLGAQGARLMAEDGGLKRGWWVWPIVALVSIVVGVAFAAVVTTSKTLAPQMKEALAGPGFSLVCASLCFAWMAVFSKFVRRTGAVMGSLQTNSYGIFLVHYVFVNWVNYALLGPSVSAAAKFAIATTAAIALSWATSALLRAIPGVSRVV